MDNKLNRPASLTNPGHFVQRQRIPGFLGGAGAYNLLEMLKHQCQLLPMTFSPEAKRARQQIVELARKMIAGEFSFIEGSREIVALRGAARFPDDDPDILTFRAIDSETETLPFGSVRKLWHKAALERLQPEIDRAEEWARQDVTEACLSLIKRIKQDLTMVTIPTDIVGRIVSGEQRGNFLKVVDDKESTGGFLILTSTTPVFDDGHDAWVEDAAALESYFEESGWLVEWTGSVS